MTLSPHNSGGLQPVSRHQLAAGGANSGNLPGLFLRSEESGKRFWEFFTVNIRNRNPRRAYFFIVQGLSLAPEFAGDRTRD